MRTKTLKEVNECLTKLGYKDGTTHKQSDFAYWKIFDGYQVGVLVYNWSRYDSSIKELGVSYECMFTDPDTRCDLSVSDNIELEVFEEMAKDCYKALKKYLKA